MTTIKDKPENPPNETLYVSNLNEKVKLDQLKAALTEKFVEAGPVVDVIAHKNIWMRGQAFVVFDSIDSARRGHELGGELFGKKMIVRYARSKSDATVQRHESPQELELHKEKRLQEKERNKTYRQQWLRLRGFTTKKDTKSTKHKGPEDEKLTQPSTKRARVSQEVIPPNNILLVQDLDSATTPQEVIDVFQQFDGFVEVRMVSVRRLAFIEFSSITQATRAKNGAGLLKIREKELNISYAK